MRATATTRRAFLERATQLAIGQAGAPLLRADEVRPAAATRHGAYFALDLPAGAGKIIGPAMTELIRRLDLRNEFDAPHPVSAATVGFLRRTQVTPRDFDDDQLVAAAAVMHVSSETPEPVLAFDRGLRQLAAPNRVSALSGVVRPLRYTGNTMHNYGYAHRVIQQSGSVMPNVFLLPLTKTAAWWKKDWWERHTFFLPRYDESGRMLSQGHALAAAAGISCLMRRTYWNATEPAPPGEYDFINYFECADEHIPTFHDVCTALRNTKNNPEWAFVREGPTWQGRRVTAWEELFA